MKKSKTITMLAIDIIIGFLAGFMILLEQLRLSSHNIIANQYIQYKMFRLVALGSQEVLYRWLILTIIVSLALFVMSLLGKWLLPGIVEVHIKDKKRLRIILAFIVCSVFLFWGGWAINHFWLPHKFHPKSLLSDAGILLFTVLVGWLLVRCRWRTLPKFIRATALALALFLLFLNIAAAVVGKMNVPRGPNIVLIGVDTLRADHLKCYGYSRETSPEIDKLAEEGIIFSQCISPIPATTPSFASILTSKQPISHGVLDNCYQLDDLHVSLAEVLRNRGYNTAAFVSGETLRRGTNLTQGFGRYNDTFRGERQAALVNKEALRWLEDQKNSRFFLFIHYFDPHGKYNPPRPHNDRFDRTTELHDISKIPAYQRHDNISDPSFYVAQYDGEIRYTDHHIGQVLEKISALGLQDQTLIIFVSDHGETMTEHLWWFDHGCFLYEEQIHVPLLLWYPKVFRHKRIDALVRLIDITPTILDVLGIEFSEGLEGRSLLPLIKGDPQEQEFVYCETPRGKPTRNREVIQGIKGKQFAVRSKKWKLIRTPKTTGVHYELYDLEQDPKELHNLIGQNIPAEKQLRTRLDTFVEAYESSPYYYKALQDEIDEKKEVRGILGALGYL